MNKTILIIGIIALFIAVDFASGIIALDIEQNDELIYYNTKGHPQKLSDEEILRLRYRDSPTQYRYMTEDGRIHIKTIPKEELISEQAQYYEDIPLISTTGGDGNHQPIYIDGNDDFTPDNGVTGGSGTEGDPYIIENWVIVYDEIAEHGIFVNDTDAYFIIRNCTISGFIKKYCAGIRLDNVENGRFEDVDANQNYIGMYITYSSYIIISNCTSHHNSIHGIGCYYCSNIIITSCECYNNIEVGIQFAGTSYSTIENSMCYNNNRYGIEVGWCDFGDQVVYNTIKDCIIHHNRYLGIRLWRYSKDQHPGYTHITRCEIYNNGDAGIGIDGMHNNIIEDCNIHHNERGIFIGHCSNNIIRNCSIFSQYIEGAVCAEGIVIAAMFIDLDLSINNQIINCDISDNEVGIWLVEAFGTKVYKNNVFNNSIHGIAIGCLPFAISTGFVTYNNIYNNGFEDIEKWCFYTKLAIIDARHNWWGSKLGPSTKIFPNRGDKLITQFSFVLFRPWAKELIPDAGR